MSTSNDDKPSLEARVRALITWPTDGISIDECLEIIDRSMGNSEVLLREIDSLEVNPAGTMARIAELEDERDELNRGNRILLARYQKNLDENRDANRVIGELQTENKTLGETVVDVTTRLQTAEASLDSWEVFLASQDRKALEAMTTERDELAAKVALLQTAISQEADCLESDLGELGYKIVNGQMVKS